jgi:hypothetical protein
MTTFKANIGRDKILIHFEDGEVYTVLKDNPLFDKVNEEVRAEYRCKVEVEGYDVDGTYLLEILNPIAVMQNQIGDVKGVVVTRSGVTYNGEDLDNSLTKKIVDHNNDGLPITPLTNFLARLMKNTRYTSQRSLYDFIDANDMVFDDDGCFLAYKIVGADYMSLYRGNGAKVFDNTPGQVVKMSAGDVDDDRNNTCSRGLHVCSRNYLPHYGNGSTDKVVIVKVDPEHVVAVPGDYNNAKMRVSEYLVVGELTDKQNAELFDKLRVQSAANRSSLVEWHDFDDEDEDSDEDYDPCENNPYCCGDAEDCGGC